MIAFVKRKKDFKTVASAETIAWDVPLASIEDDVGSITLYGNTVSRGHEGDFLIMDGRIWLIDQVSPEQQQTTVSVVDVRMAFDRFLPYLESDTSIGSWLAEQLESHYKFVSDSAYAMPYILVSNTDVTPFLGPNVEDGLFSLKTYMRKVNRLRDIQVNFSVIHRHDCGDHAQQRFDWFHYRCIYFLPGVGQQLHCGIFVRKFANGIPEQRLDIQRYDLHLPGKCRR